MKFVLSALTLCVSAFGHPGNFQTGASTVRDIRIEGLELKPVSLQNQRFLKLSLKSDPDLVGTSGEIGAPRLPVIRLSVRGDGDIQVTAGPRHWSNIALPPEPVLAPVARQLGARPIVYVDRYAYVRDSVLPPETYEVEPAGTKDGVTQRILTLHPVSYSASRNQLGWIESFHVQVFEPALPTLLHTLGRQRFGFIVDKRFENSPALGRLKDFKKALGYETSIAFVKPGMETPDEIRTQLQKWYRDPNVTLTHVLLVGDHGGVPAQPSDRLDDGGVTDHYYRSLDDPYESDIGSPDIAVGRFSAETESQLAAIVDKSLFYERGDSRDPSWLKRWSFIGTDDTSPGNAQMVEDTHDYAIQTFTKAFGFIGRFPANPEAGGDRLYAIGQHATDANVRQALNDGRGFVNYGGHGDSVSWLGPHLTSQEVGQLTHPEAAPFISSQACNTGDFRVDSFGEAWQRRGAIGFWGSMDVLFWDPADDRIGRAEYEMMFQRGKRSLAEIVYGSITEGWKFLGGTAKSPYYWETYVLLGDPSVRLRTAVPTDTVLTVAPVNVGATEVDAFVKDRQGNPLVGVRVGVSDTAGTFRAAAETGISGSVRVTLPAPAAAGLTLGFSASGDNLKMSFLTFLVH